MAKRKHPITGCYADLLFGEWLIDAASLERVVAQALQFDLNELVKMNLAPAAKSGEEAEDAPDAENGYELHGKTALMHINGVLTKRPTSFQKVMDNSSYTGLMTNLRTAVNDPAVDEILLQIESPGGTTAGAYEAADMIHRVNTQSKRVRAHISDIGTSAGYLLASQCDSISADRGAAVGSVGTITILRDTSGAYKAEGIKVIPVASGKFKSVGASGTPISDEQLAYVQDRINAVNRNFINAVIRGRGMMPSSRVEAIASEAKVYTAGEAMQLGLIDRVCNFDEALASPTPTSGTPRVGTHVAASAGELPARSNTSMFTPEQVKQIQKLPGASAVTEATANLEQVVFEAATKLQGQVSELTSANTKLNEQLVTAQAATPKFEDATILSGRRELVIEKMGLMVQKGTMLPSQVDMITKMLGDEKTPNATMLSRQNGQPSMVEQMLKPFELNKPAGLTEKQTAAQPVERQVPGAEKPSEANQVEQNAQAFLNRQYAQANTPIPAKA